MSLRGVWNDVDNTFAFFPRDAQGGAYRTRDLCPISPLASEDNRDACHVSEDCRRILEPSDQFVCVIS